VTKLERTLVAHSARLQIAGHLAFCGVARLVAVLGGRRTRSAGRLILTLRSLRRWLSRRLAVVIQRVVGRFVEGRGRRVATPRLRP
jgi:hypothetical protein